MKNQEAKKKNQEALKILNKEEKLLSKDKKNLEKMQENVSELRRALEKEHLIVENKIKRLGYNDQIGVYCYDVKTWDADDDIIDEKLIIIGNNEEKIKERIEDGIQDFYSGETSDYTLKRSFKISSSEVMERFGLKFGLIESTINEILGGKNIEEYYDIDDAFRDCGLSIEELREKRKIDSEKLKADEKIDSEHFDAEEIISKITSEYALTPKRKEALIESIRMLK